MIILVHTKYSNIINMLSLEIQLFCICTLVLLIHQFQKFDSSNIGFYNDILFLSHELFAF